MRTNPLAVVAAFACLSACGSAEVEQPAAAPVDPRMYKPAAAQVAGNQKSPLERNREAAEGFARTLGSNDTKALSDLLDPDVDFTFPGRSDATDRAGTLKAVEDLLGPFSNRKFVLGRLWQIGEAAIVEWQMSGTQTGVFMGAPPTQKDVRINGATLVWFNLNGLINEVHIYFDCGSVLAELGSAPNKAIEVGPTTAVSSTEVTTVAGGTPEEKANVALVNASWDALEAKNESGYLAPIADGIEVTRMDRNNVEKGKEDRRKFFRAVASGISSLSQTPLNAWGAGNYVLEEYTLTGVHSGSLLGLPPSGHALRLHYLDIDEVENGKIVRTWTYGNVLEIYAESGTIPSAAPASTASAPPPAASAAASATKPSPRPTTH